MHWLSLLNEEKPTGIYKKQEILMALLVLRSSLDLGYSLLKLHKLTYVSTPMCTEGSLRSRCQDKIRWARDLLMSVRKLERNQEGLPSDQDVYPTLERTEGINVDWKKVDLRNLARSKANGKD